MAHEDLTLSELIGRAYARALPPVKFTKLVQARFSGKEDLQYPDEIISSALLPFLLPSLPSLILSYLSHLLSSTSLLNSQTIFTHLLFYIHTNDLPPTSSIVALTNILTIHPTGLDNSIPSLLSPPPSDSQNGGPSSPKTSNQISTLSLLLPLLRLSSSNPPDTVSSLNTYLSKFISVLSAFPSPSLDVGLEAGQLLPNLPEEIGTPLRGLLSGLMTDLDNQDMINQQQSGVNEDVQMDNVISQNIKPGEGSRLPLKQTLAFFLEYIKRTNKLSRKDTQDGYRSLVKVGKEITNDPEEFLRVLLEVAIQTLVGSDANMLDAAQYWGVLIEDICGLLGWWKKHGEEGFAFPSDVVTPLSIVFSALSASMQTFSDQLTQRYSNLIQQAENEDDGSAFTPLEGWHLLSLQETLMSNLVQLGALDSQQASAIAPGVNVHTFTPGESLINRISFESHPHLPPLVHTIQYAYGASSTFSAEFIQIIKSCPNVPPPENLFNYIASQPGLLGALITQISPLALLDIMQKQLLDLGVDEQGRNDDPQGSLTRFGEGVALVEAFVAYHQLPLPALLQDARCAVGFSHLDEESKECMNGWVKAIFGSDGIEDAILLATPPQKLYKLSPTLIQQAILAVTASQIDLDTLHSGLSYFSQPLLSWCLGGVVAWLCREIKRQGLLSAIHLIVLQDLILGHSCPEALIRVNSTALNELLSPNSGLAPVIESSSFDLAGIRSKLDSLGLNASLPSNTMDLNGALGVLRQIDLAQLGWERGLLDPLEKEVKWRGRVEVTRVIMEELSNPQMIVGDNLAGFTPLLLAISIDQDGGSRTLLENLIHHSEWLLSPSPPITHLLKRSLVFYSALGRGEKIILELADELEYLVSLPVRPSENPQGQGTKQRKIQDGLFTQVSTGQREVLEGLIRGLRDDEDLRSRFAVVGRLDRVL
ncbi:hypothetical protein I302_101201 [Kwoniella bestiolae CBS 10118]|uniref:Mediator of RNA polymerase II transcription subunit 5 n=1 Tax=Kwoniella bestiolae CBS 10118 TaxID=1296100 RepID=A0A1B9G773_9TREE|nr:hypothetical protein I302_04574 [Kwoniella bestiolae CBS 10118]OCF26884.1 hypothetical protein I302_04574 [Kwoniella bestiolae CBS 10118]